MRVATLSEFGPPDVLTVAEVDEPIPGDREVLIDVAFANVTFVDTQVRAGRPPNPALSPPLPLIPGNGVGGVVVAVGRDVEPGAVGRRVLARTGGSGGYAERVAVAADELIPVPDALDLRDAVALLADGRTALGLMRAAAPRPGEVVLVEAAAGGVGSLLVQLACRVGARVIGAAGGARKAAVARSLGADVAVDYTEADWPVHVREAAGGAIDVAFDGVGGAVGRAAFALLRPGGRLSIYGMASGAFTRVDDEEARRAGVTVLRGMALGPAEHLALTVEALDAAAAGDLRPVVGQVVPLERAADAHAAIESRATVAKTLLEV